MIDPQITQIQNEQLDGLALGHEVYVGLFVCAHKRHR
jgi:hypothetical protein